MISEGHEELSAPPPIPAAEPSSPRQLSPRSLLAAQESLVVRSPALQDRSAEDALAIARESIPVPILPKLARMYITTRQANFDRQMPPLPPPTAEFLVRSRPPPSIAAPSYDELCSQIRDVQKQYTCGTAKDRAISPGRVSMRPHAGQGLQGSYVTCILIS